MSNRVRQWYLKACENGRDVPSVKGLMEYWKRYKVILDSALCDRILYVYRHKEVKIVDEVDIYKYPVGMPY